MTSEEYAFTRWVRGESLKQIAADMPKCEEWVRQLILRGQRHHITFVMGPVHPIDELSKRAINFIKRYLQQQGVLVFVQGANITWAAEDLRRFPLHETISLLDMLTDEMILSFENVGPKLLQELRDWANTNRERAGHGHSDEERGRNAARVGGRAGKGKGKRSQIEREGCTVVRMDGTPYA